MLVNTYEGTSRPRHILYHPPMLQQRLVFRRFIKGIFVPFFSIFYPHNNLACDVQGDSFD
ncbi:hypothetical protein NPX99_01475 [Bartonella sp. 220]|uniref:hypothetical protein n=1 Tax=Bartonella sp. 220B TaxID=2967260 RepID=UPI0022A8DBB1|nr:hypothetical protein [Bartonella sp. 220B]MCZ2157962.1 hypothetical protein [Bartonella sp. 220B]